MSGSDSTDNLPWPVAPHSLIPQRSEDEALPSSFIMMDGTDWDTHIGSIFGDQVARKTSSIDFGGPLHNDNSFAEQHIERTDSQHNDYISLQDVIDADQHELILAQNNDSWLLTQRLLDHQSNINQLSYPAGYHHAPTSVVVDNLSDVDKHSTPEAFDIAESTDPCYARLLWTCLREAPNNTLSLKDIYEWIREHTSKAKDPKNKGWQNSVRHNLSMNAAFERVNNSSNGEGKKGSLWRLTENAIKQGVISTTRYRRDPKRKPERRGQPAIKRQISGAKGGAATRRAAQMRRLYASREQIPFLPQYTSSAESTPRLPDNQMMPHDRPASPYFDVVPPSASSSPYEQPVQYSSKGYIQPLEMSYIHHDGMFGNVDSDRSNTPGTLTDCSLFTEDFSQISRQY